MKVLKTHIRQIWASGADIGYDKIIVLIEL